MAAVIAFVNDNKAIILAALFFLSEALALIPALKANSVFQLVYGLLAKAQPTELPKV